MQQEEILQIKQITTPILQNSLSAKVATTIQANGLWNDPFLPVLSRKRQKNQLHSCTKSSSWPHTNLNTSISNKEDYCNMLVKCQSLILDSILKQQKTWEAATTNNNKDHDGSNRVKAPTAAAKTLTSASRKSPSTLSTQSGQKWRQAPGSSQTNNIIAAHRQKNNKKWRHDTAW